MRSFRLHRGFAAHDTPAWQHALSMTAICHRKSTKVEVLLPDRCPRPRAFRILQKESVK